MEGQKKRGEGSRARYKTAFKIQHNIQGGDPYIQMSDSEGRTDISQNNVSTFGLKF